MKILFLGGTGIISSACSNLAISKEFDLYLLNRGSSQSLRPAPKEATIIEADIRNKHTVLEAIGDLTFDVVVDWLSFNEAQIAQSIEIFENRTKQYIFISSASVYQTPPKSLPVTENTPVINPYWQYAQDKIACERLIERKAEKSNANFTIVRPSHTYDATRVPITGNYTSVARMMTGKPAIVVGDGTSVWTLTNHRDFAIGITGLFLNPKAYNEIFHITSDELLTWNNIVEIVAEAFEVEPIIKQVPVNLISKFDTEFGAGMLGDKMHSMIFDNSKIKAAVPEFNCSVSFSQGAKEMANWHKENQTLVDYRKDFDLLSDQLVAELSKIGL